MTRSFIPLPEGTGIEGIPNGGKIRSASDGVLSPETLGITDTGVSFGPIHLAVPEGGVLNLESMSFLPGEDSGGDGLLAVTAGGGAVAATKVTNPETQLEKRTHTRRGVLTFLGAVLAAASIADPATAQDEDDLIALNIAKFDIQEPDVPVTVTVLDIVEAVLPPTTEILVDQVEARVGTVADEGEGVTLRQVGGPVRIYIRDTLGRLQQLLAWAKSFFPEDSSLTYQREFPNGNKASDYSEDEFVRLSSHPAIINPIEKSGPERTVFTINSTEIPHIDNGGDEGGAWDVLDGTLVYEVGPNPPASSEWAVTTRLSAWQAFRN